MSRIILLLIIAVLSCGFALPETAAQRKAREQEERAWAQSISGRYDRDALLTFLKKTVGEVRSWQDVSLTKPRIGSEWKINGRGMTSGDWSFSASDPTKDDFAMSFIYRANSGERWLILKCVREAKKGFRLVSIESEEVVILML